MQLLTNCIDFSPHFHYCQSHHYLLKFPLSSQAHTLHQSYFYLCHLTQDLPSQGGLLVDFKMYTMKKIMLLTTTCSVRSQHCTMLKDFYYQLRQYYFCYTSQLEYLFRLEKNVSCVMCHGSKLTNSIG